MQTAVNTLQTTVNRLRDDITEPFERVRREARQLGNLHALIDALRLVNHRIKLTAKLRQVMTGDAAIDAMDLAKGAKLVNEVDSVAAEGDLAGIDVIDRCAAALPRPVLAPSAQAPPTPLCVCMLQSPPVSYRAV